MHMVAASGAEHPSVSAVCGVWVAAGVAKVFETTL